MRASPRTRLSCAALTCVVLLTQPAYGGPPVLVAGPPPESARPAGSADPPPSLEACGASYEEGQVAMRRGRLTAAERALSRCLDAACPREMRADCGRWLDEVERRMPRVVVRCVDPDGRALTDVVVEVDGAAFATHLDGRALPIDPGEHDVRVSPPGLAPRSVHVLIAEGDKAQSVAIEYPRRLPSPPPPRGPERQRARDWPTYVLAGVGLGAGLGFGGFAIAGRSAKGDLDGCKPDCTDAQVDVVKNRYLVADMFLGVSIASFAGLALYLFARPSRH